MVVQCAGTGKIGGGGGGGGMSHLSDCHGNHDALTSGARLSPLMPFTFLVKIVEGLSELIFIGSIYQEDSVLIC